MNTSPDRSSVPSPASARDGFDILDVCHRQTVYALGKLAALVARLAAHGADAQARELAAEILLHFSTTAREHHEDEEQHVFPKLLASDDPDIVQAVLSLRQHHDRLAEDWMALSPHIDAVACGHSGHDLDVLREGAAVFTALSHDHIALEEAIVYPRARARLHSGDSRAMALEMAARRRSAAPVPDQRSRTSTADRARDTHTIIDLPSAC